jgi:hypothetical protein
VRTEGNRKKGRGWGGDSRGQAKLGEESGTTPREKKPGRVRRLQERGEMGRGGGARQGEARRWDIGRRNNTYARTRTLA